MNINPMARPMAAACGLSSRSTTVSGLRVKTRTICLRRGEVLRLEEKSGVKNIAAKTGLIWLTSTPADADVLLQSGESFRLNHKWPYLIEALAPVELSLFSLSEE
ncbi:MAG TPA: DUF2917 domain-containing protein [Verrucomicrobiae bacterium]|jgi:hypothetical protein